MILVAAPLSASCQIYIGPSVANTALVLSNFASSDTPNLLLSDTANAAPLVSRQVEGSPASSRRKSPPPEWVDVVQSIAREKMISPKLIHAVISAESNYDPLAKSSRGAVGLMQVLPATARRFGIMDPKSPRENLAAGASYLKFLMTLFDGDIELTLAAYNAGERAVVNAGRRVPDYPETIAYVRSIMAHLSATDALAMGEQGRRRLLQ